MVFMIVKQVHHFAIMPLGSTGNWGLIYDWFVQPLINWIVKALPVYTTIRYNYLSQTQLSIKCAIMKAYNWQYKHHAHSSK